ncbi:MAG: hypothetical protein MHPSP_002442, partial [Paramarteilia canceri]
MAIYIILVLVLLAIIGFILSRKYQKPRADTPPSRRQVKKITFKSVPIDFNVGDGALLVQAIRKIIETFLENFQYFLSRELNDHSNQQITFSCCSSWTQYLTEIYGKDLSLTHGSIFVMSHDSKGSDHDFSINLEHVKLQALYKLKFPNGKLATVHFDILNVNAILTLNLNLSQPFNASIFFQNISCEQVSSSLVSNQTISANESVSLAHFTDAFYEVMQFVKANFILDGYFRIVSLNERVDNSELLKEILSHKFFYKNTQSTEKKSLNSENILLFAIESLLISPNKFFDNEKNKKIKIVVNVGNKSKQIKISTRKEETIDISQDLFFSITPKNRLMVKVLYNNTEIARCSFNNNEFVPSNSEFQKKIFDLGPTDKGLNCIFKLKAFLKLYDFVDAAENTNSLNTDTLKKGYFASQKNISLNTQSNDSQSEDIIAEGSFESEKNIESIEKLSNLTNTIKTKISGESQLTHKSLDLRSEEKAKKK